MRILLSRSSEIFSYCGSHIPELRFVEDHRGDNSKVDCGKRKSNNLSVVVPKRFEHCLSLVAPETRPNTSHLITTFRKISGPTLLSTFWSRAMLYLEPLKYSIAGYFSTLLEDPNNFWGPPQFSIRSFSHTLLVEDKSVNGALHEPKLPLVMESVECLRDLT